MEDIKATSVFVSSIFEEPPKQWGLRGDPYLWEEMKNEFSTVPVKISLEDFEKRFKEIFEKLTGAPLTRECHVFVSKYAQGGMSGGQICGEFWIDKALPLLLARLKEGVNI
ncbi:MAG: hypothetical protein J6A11_06740 [Lachnospiraceae bacterium]|nr:hypothetical protein [Lachnospiraceae bacterium]